MDPMTTVAVGTAIVLVAFAIFTLVFRWIWNATVPTVFGLKRITFWQAVGILVLASILTGGHRMITTDLQLPNLPSLPKRSLAPAPMDKLPA